MDLLMICDSGSNIVLAMNSSMLNNFVPCPSSTGTTGDRLANVTGYGELRAISSFKNNKFAYRIYHFMLCLLINIIHLG